MFLHCWKMLVEQCLALFTLEGSVKDSHEGAKVMGKKLGRSPKLNMIVSKQYMY